MAENEVNISQYLESLNEIIMTDIFLAEHVSKVPNAIVFEVPQHYFENFAVALPIEKAPRVVLIFKKQIWKYAASVGLLIAIGFGAKHFLSTTPTESATMATAASTQSNDVANFVSINIDSVASQCNDAEISNYIATNLDEFEEEQLHSNAALESTTVNPPQISVGEYDDVDLHELENEEAL